MRQLTIEEQVKKQKEFIKEEGGNLEGYIKRFGIFGQPGCHGFGGEAIFKADMDQLKKLESELRLKLGSESGKV